VHLIAKRGYCQVEKNCDCNIAAVELILRATPEHRNTPAPGHNDCDKCTVAIQPYVHSQGNKDTEHSWPKEGNKSYLWMKQIEKKFKPIFEGGTDKHYCSNCWGTGSIHNQLQSLNISGTIPGTNMPILTWYSPCKRCSTNEGWPISSDDDCGECQGYGYSMSGDDCERCDGKGYQSCPEVSKTAGFKSVTDKRKHRCYNHRMSQMEEYLREILGTAPVSNWANNPDNDDYLWQVQTERK